ncbi:hypothetical protein LY76DRAFT_598221 [Colletotrichum caudatum]|nr:hypothetical protein LY76DRAFT_598221 [Colletotrichum caudatum]
MRSRHSGSGSAPRLAAAAAAADCPASLPSSVSGEPLLGCIRYTARRADGFSSAPPPRIKLSCRRQQYVVIDRQGLLPLRYPLSLHSRLVVQFTHPFCPSNRRISRRNASLRGRLHPARTLICCIRMHERG